MLKRSLLFTLTLICIIGLSMPCFADKGGVPHVKPPAPDPEPTTREVGLMWEANTEPDLAGYRIFVRKDGDYYNYLDPAWETIDTECTIYDLDLYTTYHMVARAFDTDGNESADSNEITLEALPKPDNPNKGKGHNK